MPKPSEYTAIRAWGEYLGSMDYYIEQVQEQAAEANAPLDAIYLRIGPAQWVTVRDLAPENRFRVQWYADNPPPKRSPRLEHAIAGLVREEGDPAMTSDEVREYGRSCALTETEIELLVEISQGPIGY